MKKIRHLFLSLFLISIGTLLFAQDAITALQNGENLNVIYRNEANISVLAHTNGFGFNYRRCRHITATKKGIFEIEAVNMRHDKEIKTSNPYFDNSKGFYYGKLNSLQIIRPGLGYQKTLYRKAERKSIEIRLGTFVGASFGLSKPIYLEILQETSLPNEYIIKQERYNPNKHYIDNIYGRSPYFKGFNETKIHTGAYAKLALSFEYADYHNDVKAIETGITLDAFPKAIPIMAFAPNQQVYLTFYISLVYGKKWF